MEASNVAQWPTTHCTALTAENDPIPNGKRCCSQNAGDSEKLPVLGEFWPSHVSARQSSAPPHPAGPPTWNWALMLGGFFFLCRCSRDLVVRSCRVILIISFRDLESSRF